MAPVAVHWELCSTNFCENIANLWVPCYNGNNDRSARVLFVQHSREQGERIRQNPHYSRVIWLHHSPCSLGCWTNNTLEAQSLSPIFIALTHQYLIFIGNNSELTSQIAKFMGLTWGPPGSCRPQMGPMLAPWTLLSGLSSAWSLTSSLVRDELVQQEQWFPLDEQKRIMVAPWPSERNTAWSLTSLWLPYTHCICIIHHSRELMTVAKYVWCHCQLSTDKKYRVHFLFSYMIYHSPMG